jgi:hypothetical protein
LRENRRFLEESPVNGGWFIALINVNILYIVVERNMYKKYSIDGNTTGLGGQWLLFMVLETL